MGDLVDAIETVSGHLITTHVHDNRGKLDDHLAPFDGKNARQGDVETISLFIADPNHSICYGSEKLAGVVRFLAGSLCRIGYIV